jgi:Glycosyltransferase family 87
VVAQSPSLSRPQPEPRVFAATFVAVALFVGAWSLLHVGFYKRDQVLDTPIYQRYGNAIARGEVPYRDFSVEYPPGALPVFALPGLAEPGHDQQVSTGFRHAFETLMWACGAAALGAMAVAFWAMRASQLRVWSALAYAAVAPLLLGSVVLSRFDLWPAALVAGALAALVAGRLRIGNALLGLGIAAKWFPVVLVPLSLVYVWKREGRREAAIGAAVLVAVVILVFAPFVALSPGGVRHSLTGQLTRPLQLESLGSGLLLAAHHAWGFGITQETSHGSQNLVGHVPRVLAAVQTALQIAALLGVWVLFARTRATREGLLRASAAALVVFVALGKVLSPQFLIWLVPVVPLVRGRRGLGASAGLAVALVLTQLWFPFRYWDLANHFDAFASWVVLARDVVLVALAAVLVLPSRDELGDARELVADERRPAQRARFAER